MRPPRPRPAVFLLLVAVSAAARVIAQSQPSEQPPLRDNRLFRSGIEVTSITATVTDRDGHPLTTLQRDDFEVYEDGLRQTVTQFTHERVPIGLGVLLDISDSMFGKRIQDARAAVDRFLFDLLDPADEFFLVAFNHRPRVLTGWTREQKDVQRALDGLRPSGGTAIYDAIIEALPVLERRSRERAALLLISDGADTASSTASTCSATRRRAARTASFTAFACGSRARTTACGLETATSPRRSADGKARPPGSR